MIARVFAIALSLVFAGCAAMGLDNYGSSPRNSCVADTDCAADAICDVQRSICVTETLPASDPMRIALRVSTGVAGSPWQVHRATPIIGATSQLLVLHGVARVTGTVNQRMGDGSLRTVRARISLVPIDDANELENDRISTTTMTGEDLGRFTLSAVANTPYCVVVQPQQSDATLLPPMRMYVDEPLMLSSGDNDPIEIVYPPPADATDERGVLSILRGVVLDSQGSELIGLGGVAVEAFDSSGAQISSIAVTSEETDHKGEFQLFALKAFDSFQNAALRVRSLDDTQHIPTRTVSIDALTSTTDEQGNQVFLFVLPHLRSVCVRGSVEYDPNRDALNGGGSPGTEPSQKVRGALLRFELAPSESNGTSFEAGSVVTTDDGEFSAQLLVGTDTSYTITIVPPDSLPNAGVLVVQEDLNLAPTTDCLTGRTYVLGRRGTMSGTLLAPPSRDGSQAMAAGATVHATPYAPVAGRAGTAARASEAMSDTDGSFALDLDPQYYYDVRLSLPDDSNYPWVVLTNFVAPSRATLAREFSIDVPVVLDGTLRDDDGAPMAGAQIEAYAIVRSTTGQYRSVLVAKGSSSGVDGSYQLLLPHAVLGVSDANTR